MRKKTLLQVLSIVTLTYLFYACENHVIETEEPKVNIDTTTVSFNNDIKPLISNNCVICHSPSSRNISPNLSTYQQIKSNIDKIEREVESRRMPQGRTLSNEQIQKLLKWIDKGALNN